MASDKSRRKTMSPVEMATDVLESGAPLYMVVEKREHEKLRAQVELLANKLQGAGMADVDTMRAAAEYDKALAVLLPFCHEGVQCLEEAVFSVTSELRARREISSPASETLLEERVLMRLRISRKGDGFVIGLGLSVSYIECWVRDGKRLFECVMFDGMRSDSWAEDAILALETAQHWKRTGVMRGAPADEG